MSYVVILLVREKQGKQGEVGGRRDVTRVLHSFRDSVSSCCLVKSRMLSRINIRYNCKPYRIKVD
jgi:hypothetical protein